MRVRKTARVILLDPLDRVLLVKFETTDVCEPGESPSRRVFWATVGGEIEGTETAQETLAREMREETGLTEKEAAIGPCLWDAEHELFWKDEIIKCYEQYAVARSSTDVIRFHDLQPEEKLTLKACKWWTLEELKHSNEIVYPRCLPALLEQVLAGASPAELTRIKS